MPSVLMLWHCWLGSRKGIRSVKNWVVGCWCGYRSGVRCRLGGWCHCYSLSLASVKSRLVLPFWYRLTWAVLDKGPLNRCVCVWWFQVCLRVVPLCVLVFNKPLRIAPIYMPSLIKEWVFKNMPAHNTHARAARAHARTHTSNSADYHCLSENDVLKHFIFCWLYSASEFCSNVACFLVHYLNQSVNQREIFFGTAIRHVQES